MKSFVNAVIVSSILITSSGVIAATPTETFGECLIDNLNGKERKELAKWVFFAMSSHPEIKTYSKATSNDITESDKYFGNLVTRLLTEDCSNEMNAAKVDPQAMEKAFELVGVVAMQELMTNQEVTAAMANYIKYINQEKINKILSE